MAWRRADREKTFSVRVSCAIQIYRIDENFFDGLVKRRIITTMQGLGGVLAERPGGYAEYDSVKAETAAFNHSATRPFPDRAGATDIADHRLEAAIRRCQRPIRFQSRPGASNSTVQAMDLFLPPCNSATRRTPSSQPPRPA